MKYMHKYNTANEIKQNYEAKLSESGDLNGSDILWDPRIIPLSKLLLSFIWNPSRKQGVDHKKFKCHYVTNEKDL